MIAFCGCIKQYRFPGHGEIHIGRKTSFAPEDSPMMTVAHVHAPLLHGRDPLLDVKDLRHLEKSSAAGYLFDLTAIISPRYLFGES